MIENAPLDLTVIEARVLGSLLEKQQTTPDVYPLTLKSLATACNQTSNREPVTRYTASEVEATVLALKAKGLARVVHPGSGERATKYRQVADEAYEFTPEERALICVLLLRRSPQTVAELRTRTERLAHFATTAEVEVALEALARRDPPLVARVERQPGRKEDRWLQLLEVDAAARAATAASPTLSPGSSSGGADPGLASRVAALEDRLASLIEALGDLVDLPPAPRSETSRSASGQQE